MPRTIVQAQIVGGRWVRASFIFVSFGKWIHPEKLRARRKHLPETMIDDVLLAILSLPVCVADLRAKPACGGLLCL